MDRKGSGESRRENDRDGLGEKALERVVSRMPLFRVERLENASLWMRVSIFISEVLEMSNDSFGRLNGHEVMKS